MATSVSMRTPRPKWEWRQLRVAGDDIIGVGCVKPASKSFFESSLKTRAPLEESAASTVASDSPLTMKAVVAVRRALEADQANQSRKYGCVEANAATSRFNVNLPRSPQHMKYSWRDDVRSIAEDGASVGGGVAATTGAESSRPATGSHAAIGSTPRSLQDSGELSSTGGEGRLKGFKFNMRTLQRWFRDIDRDGSGQITQREFIVALRARPETLKIFKQIQGIGTEPLEVKGDGSPASKWAKADAARQEIYRIKEILNDIDTDGNGMMEWDEFIDFFRRAGLLLEYQTRLALNRTTLCMELEQDRAVKAEAEDKRVTSRRTAATGISLGRFSADDEHDESN